MLKCEDKPLHVYGIHETMSVESSTAGLSLGGFGVACSHAKAKHLSLFAQEVECLEAHCCISCHLSIALAVECRRTSHSERMQKEGSGSSNETKAEKGRGSCVSAC